jgi:hypothetical protein
VNETDKFALLRDLAHLLRKYGLNAFSDLAGFLRDSESVTELTMILETTEAAGRKSGVPKSGVAALRGETTKENLLHLLSQVKKTEPEKAQILSGFYEALAVKRALPSLRELRSFARDNGLKPLSATSRDKAISPLVRDLSTRSIEDIRSMLKRIRLSDGALGDRSLEAWTGVILNKERSRGGS